MRRRPPRVPRPCGARVAELVAATHFSRGFVARIAGVVASSIALRRALLELRALGAAEGVPSGRVVALLVLARSSHRAALAETWLDELRALMATWGCLHLRAALLMVILIAVHVVMALRYGRVGWGVAR